MRKPDPPTARQKRAHKIMRFFCPIDASGPKKTLEALSYMMLLFGVIITISSAVMFNSKFTQIFVSFKEKKEATQIFVYGSAFFTIFCGLWGLLVIKCQECLQLSMIYGLILIPLWLVQMVVGLIFYALSYLRDRTLNSFCPENLDPSRFIFYDEVS